MIPKIIHYIWLGSNKKPDIVEKCIKSWKIYCPGYKFMEWGNEILDEIDNDYVKEAMKAKKYAFAADYIRLYVLNKYGGVYLDTDTELKANIDEFLEHDFFIGQELYKNEISVSAGLIGTIPNNAIIKDLLNEYNNIHFIRSDGKQDLFVMPKRFVQFFKNYGINAEKLITEFVEIMPKCIIYPHWYFCTPKEENICFAVHHYNGSWITINIPKLILETIFSVKNTEDKKHKVITILGIKIKFAQIPKKIKNLKNPIQLKEKAEFKKATLLFKYDYISAQNNCGVNLGDYVQTIATKNIIQKIYPNQNFIYWDRDNLLNYTETPAFAIMQGWFAHSSLYMPNEKILPVFIGTHITTPKRKEFLLYIKKNPKYFNKITFGCRDTSTLNFMRKNNVNSYLSRCLTLTYPKREVNINPKDIFIVDMPEEYLKYVPNELLEHAKFVNQRAIDTDKDTSYFLNYERYMKQTSDLLSEYRNNAKLVITSALHCASPCIAMGIPTILIDFEDKNDRFGSLNGIIKIYNKQDLINRNINYSPEVTNIEDLKQLMIKNVELSIKQAFDEEIDEKELNNIRQLIEKYNIID